MKKISRLLIQFLESNIGPLIRDRFKNTKFSDNSRKFFTILLDQILIANKYSIPFELEKCDKLPKGANYEILPEIARNNIENMKKNVYQTKFEISGHSIQIYFVCPTTFSKKYIHDSIEKIRTWLQIAFNYSPKKCSQQLNIYLYLTDLIKMLPPYGKPISEINANTAFTTSCKPTTEINLFREEEWFKVLIHETFHSLGLDFSELNNKRADSKILSIFPIKSDVRIFETYCETWAEIINVLFIVYYSTKHNGNEPNIDRMIKRLEMLLDQERLFSLFQLVKVLHFYGLDYSDLFTKSEMANIKRNNRYKESTNILSYYILKPIFIYYVDDFISWCIEHNKNVLNFNKLPSVLYKNMNDYCNFVEERYKKNEYKSLLSTIEGWYNKINPNTLNIIELKTLRMSILEE